MMLKESNAIEGVYDLHSLQDAVKAWEFIMQFDTLNNMIVRQTHKILMSNQNLERKYRGEWRDVPVWIANIKKDDPPLVINAKMQDWCKATNTVDRNFDPVTLHIAFEEIHPFIDGNGRMGRILLNWHLVKRNNSVLLVYTEDDKQTYYRLFQSYRSREFAQLIERMQDIWKKERM